MNGEGGKEWKACVFLEWCAIGVIIFLLLGSFQ